MATIIEKAAGSRSSSRTGASASGGRSGETSPSRSRISEKMRSFSPAVT